jgi:hypothetical protein
MNTIDTKEWVALESNKIEASNPNIGAVPEQARKPWNKHVNPNWCQRLLSNPFAHAVLAEVTKLAAVIASLVAIL